MTPTQPPLRIDAGRCTACGLCLASCPVQALALPSSGAVQVSAACIACGACLDSCPEQALSLPPGPAAARPSAPPDCWIWGQHQDGRWHPVVAELIALAATLFPPQAITVLAAGAPHQATVLAGDLGGLPLARLLWVEHPDLHPHRDGAVAEALTAVLSTQRPAILLAGATDRGRALMPRLAALLATGLTADCTALALDPASGGLLQTRPAFGGNILATIRTAQARPQMATVRSALFPAPSPRPGAPAPAVQRISAASAADPVRLLERRALAASAGAIAEASIVVAGGRGLGSAAAFDRLRILARRLGGAVAASRSAVEAGWADETMQVGQTGRSIHPRLYIAIGISGAVQHLAGIAGAHCVVAINHDPLAPIIQRADHVLIGDGQTLVEAWLERLPEVGQ